MKFTIEVPEIEKRPKGVLSPGQAKELTEAIFAKLYDEGLFSEKQACDLAGLTRREFGEVLSRHDSGSLRYSPKNLNIELQQKSQ